MRRPLLCLGLSTFAALPALAADPVPAARPLVAPLVNCPPVVLPNCPPGSTMGPTMPWQQNTTGVPGSLPPVVDPSNPAPGPIPGADAQPQTNAGVDSQFARQSESGTQAANTIAPNMWGDILGARSLRFSTSTRAAITFGYSPGQSTGSNLFVVPSDAASKVLFTSPTTGTTQGIQGGFGTGAISYNQPLAANGAAQFDTVRAQATLQSILSNGLLTPAQAQLLSNNPQLLQNRGQINALITQATKGLTLNNVQVSNVGGRVNPDNTLTYDALLTSEQNVPLPGTGSGVGRIKMSEDNSPMPRDRIFFTQDSFGNVPYGTNGITVNRFQFGIEKTFLDGRYSAEFRLPFAGTIASTYTQGFETTDTQLGNVRFALKKLWLRNEKLNLSSGIAVSLPTAPDQVVNLAPGLDGTQNGQFYRFRNQQVQIEPFVGAIFTPNSRLFAQAWTSMNFDVTGGDFSYNNAILGTGSVRYYDLPILTVDGQVGYWLIQRSCGTVRGLAPFVELHWNNVIAQNELIDQTRGRIGQPNGFNYSLSGVGSQELNLSAGIMLQLGDNLNLAIGGSAPLFNAPNRTFDGQFGLRLNYLYGRTARARNPINSVSMY